MFDSLAGLAALSKPNDEKRGLITTTAPRGRILPCTSWFKTYQTKNTWSTAPSFGSTSATYDQNDILLLLAV
jgi:hypothetical protein